MSEREFQAIEDSHVPLFRRSGTDLGSGHDPFGNL